MVYLYIILYFLFFLLVILKTTLTHWLLTLQQNLKLIPPNIKKNLNNNDNYLSLFYDFATRTKIYSKNKSFSQLCDFLLNNEKLLNNDFWDDHKVIKTYKKK